MTLSNLSSFLPSLASIPKLVESFDNSILLTTLKSSGLIDFIGSVLSLHNQIYQITRTTLDDFLELFPDIHRNLLC